MLHLRLLSGPCASTTIEPSTLPPSIPMPAQTPQARSGAQEPMGLSKRLAVRASMRTPLRRLPGSAIRTRARLRITIAQLAVRGGCWCCGLCRRRLGEARRPAPREPVFCRLEQTCGSRIDGRCLPGRSPAGRGVQVRAQTRLPGLVRDAGQPAGVARVGDTNGQCCAFAGRHRYAVALEAGTTRGATARQAIARARMRGFRWLKSPKTTVRSVARR